MKNLLTGLILLFTCTVYGQTDTTRSDTIRAHKIMPDTAADGTTIVKKEEPKKDSVKITAGRLLSVLESAQGYIKDENGKWVSSYNRIPYYTSDYNNEFYEKYRLGTENFRQLRIMELSVDKKLYYGLLWLKNAGYYADPDSMFDWKYFTAADFYLIENEDFKKMIPDTMKFNQPYYVDLRVKYAGTIPYTHTSQFESRINRYVNDYVRTAHLYDTTVKTFFQFTLHPVKNNKGTFMRFNTWLGYAVTGKLPDAPPIDALKEQYYETSFEAFKQFAKP